VSGPHGKSIERKGVGSIEISEQVAESGSEPVWNRCRGDFCTPKMEAILSSETSVYIRSTRRHIPEDGILQNNL
jgi:hypothetical protein